MRPVGSPGEPDPVLVTGGAGFVGATLVRRLLEGGWRVRVFDDLSTGDPSHLAGLDVDLIEGDVRDPCSLHQAMAGARAVVHLAAAGSVVGSIWDPLRNFEVNVTGTFRVLDTARQVGVDRLVLASTGGALFGRAVPPVTEATAPSPISPYGASKLAAEGFAQAFAASYGLRTVVLRFANVYGPWCTRKTGVLVEFLRALRDGRPLVIYGDGSASRDFVHVDDIAAAVKLALMQDLEGGTVLHLGSGRETTLEALSTLCRAVAGVPYHPVEHRAGRQGEVLRNFCSYEAARRMLGFRPAVALEDGVARTWRWLIDR